VPNPIPFNRAFTTGRELDYIAQVLAGRHTSGDGRFTRGCSEFLRARIGGAHALLTTSCTHALDMSALLLGLSPGDEVIVPSFTFVSTANAFALRGATPVFVDVRPDTFNIDERLIEQAVTSRTRAIAVVHYAGVGCEMDAILRIAERHGLDVVEDNAHGLFGSYRGRPLGSFGRYATQSFHETKNIQCGEGGALIVQRPQDVLGAEIAREKGTNRSEFFRGHVDKYTWKGLGSSYLPSEILAAYLHAQFENAGPIQERRAAIWRRYYEGLAPWAAATGVRLPFIPADREQAYHMFYLVFASLDARQAAMQRLSAAGIMSVFHYQPLHVSDMGRRFGGVPGQCPVTEMAGDCLLRLPFHYELSTEEQDHVIEEVSRLRP
jgi:dTDP-4-amino-4,6-dideoxygalactose transaminase